MRPAARIRCSSSERCIHAPALAGRQHACERRGLRQADCRFVSVRDQRGDFRPGAIEDLAPLLQRARHGITVARDPFFEIPPGRGEEPPVGFDLARDQAVHREAACLDDAVLQHAGRDRRGCHGPPPRRDPQARRAPAGAVTAHALGCGLGAAGQGASGAAVGHLIIVTSYDNKRNPPSPARSAGIAKSRRPGLPSASGSIWRQGGSTVGVGENMNTANATLSESRWRYFLLAIVAIGSLALMLSSPPIAQDPQYHEFADRRAFFGIPTFWADVSNIPFLLVGIARLMVCLGLDIDG